MGACCCLGSMKFNFICYADDVVLLAPSRAGLQLLIYELSDLLRHIGPDRGANFHRGRGRGRGPENI